MCRLKFDLLGDAERIINLDAKITHGALQLRVAEQQLHCSQIAGLLVNLCRLRSAQRMRAICRAIEPGAVRPSMDDAGVLPRRQVRLSPQTAWEQILSPCATETGQPISDSASGLLGNFELNRSARLLLDYRRSIANPPARAHVVDNEVAAPQLGVNGETEHREITFAAFQRIVHTSLASRGAFDRSGVPCSTARGVGVGILGFP